MRPQDVHQARGDREDCNGGIGLDWVESKLTVDTVECPPDRQSALFEIDIGPRQSECFSAT